MWLTAAGLPGKLAVNNLSQVQRAQIKKACLLQAVSFKILILLSLPKELPVIYQLI